MRRFAPRASRALVASLTTVAIAVLAATASASSDREQGSAQLSVFAAASLTEVFPKIDSKPKYNFAGSNTLLQQIRQGAPVDVFASASPRETQAAFSEGLCEQPVTFAYNKVVVIVPKSNPAGIRSVFDLRKSGVKLVIAAAGVPVGDYTRTTLKNLGISNAVLANVVSNEPDVKSVAGKVALGEADAGIVYRTDVTPIKNDVDFIRIPAWSQPPVRYQICVASKSQNKAAARAFVQRVLGPVGRGNLSGALFGLPPKS
jgi:molybdate transport system substrate-binding protein